LVFSLCENLCENLFRTPAPGGTRVPDLQAQTAPAIQANIDFQIGSVPADGTSAAAE
jgi:hypothetical protein